MIVLQTLRQLQYGREEIAQKKKKMVMYVLVQRDTAWLVYNCG